MQTGSKKGIVVTTESILVFQQYVITYNKVWNTMRE